MPSEKIATSVVHNDGEPTTNILKVAWGAKGSCPEAPEGWVNAGFAHIYIGDEADPYKGTIELDADEIDHLIRVLQRVQRQAFRAGRGDASSVKVYINGTEVVDDSIKESLRNQAAGLGY